MSEIDNVNNIKLDVTYIDYTHPDEIKWVVYHSMNKTGSIVEIGCNKGTTTYELATHNLDRQIIGIDHTDETVIKTEDMMMPGISRRSGDANGDPQYYEVPTLEEFGRKVRNTPNVTLINMDSKDYTYPVDCHFIFIDGDHTYEGVKADTDKALAHINNVGGTIVWHDYYTNCPEWVGVKKYLDELNLPVVNIPGTWLAVYTKTI